MSDPFGENPCAEFQEVLRRLDALGAAPARFLTIGAAAQYTSLSADSIRRLIERGDLTALRPVGGRILVDRQELDRLVMGSIRRPRGGRGHRGGV